MQKIYWVRTKIIFKKMFKTYFFHENCIFLAYACQNSSSTGTSFSENLHNFVSTLRKTRFDVFS